VHTLTVRKIPEPIHTALKFRAQLHGRSAEAEVRDILEKAVTPAAPWLDQLRQAGKDINVLLGGKDWLPEKAKRPFKGENFDESTESQA
jgi:antitoxin FitA